MDDKDEMRYRVKGILMEHIVQFGITIDDEHIKQHIEELALDQVVADIKGDICRTLPKGYGRDKDGNPIVNWERIAEDSLRDILDEQDVRERIVERAAEMLVDKVSRTKAWREKYRDTADI